VAWTYSRRVSWAEVDLTGYWRFTTPLVIVEEAETAMMRRAGLIMLVSRLPRVSVSASFARPASFDEQVTVALDLLGIGRTSIRYGFEIMGSNGLCASGEFVVVHTNTRNRPSPVPKRVRRVLEETMAART
jgi:acyl-CoA thioesterase FadM